MGIFHLFKCTATAGSRHEKYLAQSRLPMTVWINADDEAIAENSMYDVLSQLHYEQVEIHAVKKVDSKNNNFVGVTAQEYETMLDLGWCVVAYPEPMHRKA